MSKNSLNFQKIKNAHVDLIIQTMRVKLFSYSTFSKRDMEYTKT